MFGPLAGAKGSLCQQGTDIESVPIWYYVGHGVMEAPDSVKVVAWDRYPLVNPIKDCL